MLSNHLYNMIAVLSKLVVQRAQFCTMNNNEIPYRYLMDHSSITFEKRKNHYSASVIHLQKEGEETCIYYHCIIYAYLDIRPHICLFLIVSFRDISSKFRTQCSCNILFISSIFHFLYFAYRSKSSKKLDRKNTQFNGLM